MSATVANLKYHIYNRRFGLWLFIVSESVIFLTLLVTRFYMQGTFRPHELNQVLGLIVTAILLFSSFRANLAEVAISHGDRGGFVRNILMTIFLGVAFLIGVVAVEWPEALKFAPPSSGFGTVFFATTGMHAFHVLTGVIILIIVLIQGWQGRFTPEDHWNAEAAIVYWHFVDVVWIFVYPTLYLVGS